MIDLMERELGGRLGMIPQYALGYTMINYTTTWKDHHLLKTHDLDELLEVVTCSTGSTLFPPFMLTDLPYPAH